MQNILTFDLEDWFHGNFLFESNESEYTESRVLEPTIRLLKILKRTNSRATFFTLGSVAERFPNLIREIVSDGHEIASHGYLHRLVYKLTTEEFREDVKKSVSILAEIANREIQGYRAPYWSLYPEMDWAFDVLAEAGIKYDSSIYPFKTYLYGNDKAPRFQYEIRGKKEKAIKEVPPTVMEIFKRRIPFCGGFYFRLLPYWAVKLGIKRVNEKEQEPVVFYLHPYEIDAKKTKNSKGLRNNFILHVNVKRAEKKLTRLLNDFDFYSMKEFLKTKN